MDGLHFFKIDGISINFPLKEEVADGLNFPWENSAVFVGDEQFVVKGSLGENHISIAS